eukprot:CAMPEP_0183722830 /NCGR_PEP_ID=MMETSP0737-20130205/14672_1 /TAXON_ID=385413 /ORGANISM="Thalassiosira miniscula, Strain CCMP1093" /LENGTH=419 /DNA_ID=CAMNT_0025953069 /DNA_START=366 /DNA_END=1621 /DNA_ORIENTATION=-
MPPDHHHHWRDGDGSGGDGNDQADNGALAIPTTSAAADHQPHSSTIMGSGSGSGSSADPNNQRAPAHKSINLSRSRPASHAADMETNKRKNNDPAYLQLTLPPRESPSSSNSGGGIIGESEMGASCGGLSFPFLSLQQPSLLLRGGSTDGSGAGGTSTGSIDTSSANSSTGNSKTMTPSARSFSAPEPLEDEVDSTGELLPKDRLRSEENDDADLKQAYPLLLQRSAGSAFGSPSSCSALMGKLKPRRAHSHSGNSDPGFSAFHPVWSSKSLSASSAGSVHSYSSEVGSAVSSNAAPAVPSNAVSSAMRSAHAHFNPAAASGGGEHPKKQQPAKKTTSPRRKVMARVMARMKKSSYSSGSGGNKSFRRKLSGRENPARPHLSEDESGSPVNEIREVVVVPSAPTMGDDICKDLSKLRVG